MYNKMLEVKNCRPEPLTKYQLIHMGIKRDILPDIIKAVCESFGIDAKLYLSRCRQDEYKFTRYIIWNIMFNKLNYRKNQIKHYCNDLYSHSNIIHGINAVDNEKQLRQKRDEILSKFFVK